MKQVQLSSFYIQVIKSNFSVFTQTEKSEKK